MRRAAASAVVWAAIFLGEWADVLTWVGVALVVGAGISVALAARRHERLAASA